MSLLNFKINGGYKSIVVAIGILFFSHVGFGQDSLNLTNFGGWKTDSALGCSLGESRSYNDLWGYEADGREYAILGSCWGTHFIDVTDPYNPVEVNSFKGQNSASTWRDFKTNDHYAYGVGDGGGHSLQIFDLQYLPDSVVKVYDEDSLSQSAHSIFIDNDRAYLSSNKRGGPTYALDILDISNPVIPVYDTTYGNDMFANCGLCLHDTYVRNDTIYASAGYDGMFIYDATDIKNPAFINRIEFYTDQGYNHSSWLTEDGDHLVMADEVPVGMRLKVFDVSDLLDIQEVSTFESHALATPHNPFILGNEVYLSYYMDGVQVFNIEDPVNPTRDAFYDTYPVNDSSYTGGYSGCWGVYPYLPSRSIIASDRTNGLFVLGKLQDVYISNSAQSICQNNYLEIDFEAVGGFSGTNTFYLEMSDTNQDFTNSTLIGNVVSDSSGSISAYISDAVAPGTYRIRFNSSDPALIEGTYQLLTVLEGATQPQITISSGCDLLMSSNETVDSIQWYENGIAINGANASGYTVTNDTLAMYTVEIWNSLNCSAISDGQSMSFCSVGINELQSHGFQLFPNPATYEVIISSKMEGDFTFTMVNQVGQVVKKGSSLASTVTLELGQIKRGIYFVQIQTKQVTFTQKLVVR